MGLLFDPIGLSVTYNLPFREKSRRADVLHSLERECPGNPGHSSCHLSTRCLVSPPQASSSPSPPTSARASMDGVAAFCATHSPQLTPLSLSIIVCREPSEGKTKECGRQGQELPCKAWGLGPSPVHPWEPPGSSLKMLSGIFCVPVILIQSWQAKVPGGGRRTLKNGVIWIWQNWKRH